jgi:hypothetical protein
MDLSQLFLFGRETQRFGRAAGFGMVTSCDKEDGRTLACCRELASGLLVLILV